MTTRSTRLEVDVVATDKASRTIRDVAGEADKLDATKATVDVEAVVDDDALAGIRSKLDNLTGEQREIVLKATASQLESEIRAAERALGRLDRYDNDQINVRINARDNASKKLDAVRTELRQLDGDTATIKVDGKESVDDLIGDAGQGTGLAGLGALLKGGGAAGGLAGAGGVLGKLALDFADAALEAQTLAELTGTSLENASRLLVVWQQAGLDTADLLDVLLQINQALTDNPDIAERLKVDPATMDTVELFVGAVKGLQTEYDNAGERGRVASQLFGEEGVRQVARIQTRVGDLQSAINGVSPLQVTTAADLERAREINTRMTELKTKLDEIKRVAGEAAAGGLFGLLDYGSAPAAAAGAIDMLTGWFSGNGSGSRPMAPAPADFMSWNLAGGGPNTPPTAVTIVNPPGTPTGTVTADRTYTRRNGGYRS